MMDVLWILGMFAAGTIGFFFGIIANKWGYEAEFKEIQRDVFGIVYDIGVEQAKKTPLVFRLKNLDKYFNLDEVRNERNEPEVQINPADYIACDDISPRIAVNADGTQGHRRGVKEDEWVR